MTSAAEARRPTAQPAHLDASQEAQTRQALLEEGSDALIELIFQLNLRLPLSHAARAALPQAVSLGWVDVATHALTQLGRLIADPIREYRLWLDRDRRLHGELEYDLLAPERYEGKSVLEPGCGFGCNLLTLGRGTGQCVGVEPIAIYRQLTPILAEREGLPVPQVVDGRAEALPCADQTFDVVLCYSAHQYMDIRPALREMARVLRPGGQLQIIGGVFDYAQASILRHLLRRAAPGPARFDLLTAVNTLCYERLGRRVYIPSGPAATTAPIYPRYRYMARWMTAVGLQVRDELSRRVGDEICFIADKRA